MGLDLSVEFVKVSYGKTGYFDFFRTEDFPFSEYYANGFDWNLTSISRSQIPADILKLLDSNV